MRKYTIIQKFAWFYSALFLFVVALGYIPGFTNEEGLLFGLFKIDPYDDFLHLASGIWAGIAAWYSLRASMFYFKLFGALYGLDGVVGLITERGYLDFGLFLHDPVGLDFGTRLAANMPHIVIGGAALLIGFVISRRIAQYA